MQKLPVYLTIIFAIIALFPSIGLPQMVPSLLVYSDDSKVHDDVMPLIKQQIPVISQPGDFGLMTQDIESMDGPMVVLQTMSDTPSTNELQRAFDAIGRTQANVTYVLFVDKSENVNWVSNLDLPENLRFAVSVRTIDQISVAAAYENYKISYNDSNLKYDYEKAAYLALQQLTQSDAIDKELAVEPWVSGAATMFLDSGIIQSGAPSSVAKALIEAVTRESTLNELDQRKLKGITNPKITFSSIQNDMDAVRAATLLANCVGPVPWDAYVKNNMSFMAFGRDRMKVP